MDCGAATPFTVSRGGRTVTTPLVPTTVRGSGLVNSRNSYAPGSSELVWNVMSTAPFKSKYCKKLLLPAPTRNRPTQFVADPLVVILTVSPPI